MTNECEQSPSYVIISTVKDEERYVELTLRSVIEQTLKPSTWVIVDDGSTDRTPQIIKKYISKHKFIKLVRNPNAGVRQTGPAVIRAFNFGYKFIGDEKYDFIVKLDCDLSFEPDYFEKILKRMTNDNAIGICSGVYYEKDGRSSWKEIIMPSYHSAGACKVVRKKCFKEIGRFIEAAGWDTVDEIRAMTRGWKTVHFKDLRINHHKPEGTGIGLIKTNIMHGEIYYLTGGDKVFFIFKVLHRIFMKPYLIAGLALLWGYMRSVLKRKVLLVSEAEAKYYRAKLRRRLIENANALIHGGKKSLVRMI